jgi:hypothetical protein
MFIGFFVLLVLLTICMKTGYNNLFRSLSKERIKYYQYDSDDEELLKYF